MVLEHFGKCLNTAMYSWKIHRKKFNYFFFFSKILKIIAKHIANISNYDPKTPNDIVQSVLFETRPWEEDTVIAEKS